MKKIVASIFAASLLLLGTQAFAQVIPGAGYLHVIEHSTGKDGKAVDPSHMDGFYLGASYNFRLGDYFGVAPGFYVDVLLQGRNTANGVIIGGVPLNVSSAYHYTEVDLNIPVNLTLNFEVGRNASIFAFAGPVFQLAVMARSTFSASASILGLHISDGSAYNHLDATNGDTNPFNIYLGGGAGVQVGDIQFLVGYDYSMLNRMNTKNFDGYDSRRGNLKVGINFAF